MCTDNLPPEERSDLKHLWQRTDIIIKHADKGFAVVMLSKKDNTREANRELNESIYYRKLPVDTRSQYTAEVKQCVDSIKKKTKSLLVPHYPREARLYLLPKIHKPGNPSRLSVASNGAPTEKISRFADFFYGPALSNHPHIFRTPRTS